jgi:hypothetical protein
METIDSFKLLLNPDTIRDFQQSRFQHEIITAGVNPDGEILSIEPAPKREIFVLNNLETGLKRIEFDMQKNSLIIEGSAKILHDQYMEGITANTIERVFSQINQTGVIDLNPAACIETGSLLRVDITHNIQVDNPVSEYVGALGLIPVNDKYRIETFSNESIVFNGRQRTFKERQIFYDKAAEVKRDKEIRGYFKSFGKTNIVRAEMNLAQLKRIRFYFGSNILQDVLKQPVNPNYLLFDKITHRAPNEVLQLFDEWQGVALYKIEKEEGRKKIIQQLQMDMTLIDKFLKAHVKGNISRYKKEYRTVLNDMLLKAGLKKHDIGYYTKLINELKTKLAA